MAEKELQRVRKDFIKRVTKPVINQLLDGLLEDRVLNDGEKDSILEENSSTADKARNLIDNVWKKGPKASMRMIFHIEENDSSLYSVLGLSSGQPAQPAAQPQIDPSTPAILTVQEFWEKMKNDKDCYPVRKTSYENRVALLITNIEFSNKRLNRAGAEKDEENMNKVLSSLGYKVEKHRNLTGKEIEEKIVKFSQLRELKETDSVFVVIMSHGKLGAVLGVNTKNDGDDEFPIDNIYRHLGSERCPALLNKPKIVIIQACRGEEKGSVFVSDSANQANDVPAPVVSEDFARDEANDVPAPLVSEDFAEDAVKCVHKEKDFISLLSCTPDTVSYRHKDQGSLLIQYIDEVFKTDAREDHISELFRKVLRKFESFDVSNKRQMPSIDRCTATKLFYLYPGLSGTTPP
ncbi:caspase a-like isoform X1 [Melanotaenia boesemani]|uniref:caspase a-like isoform X1 n=1 Tax=Melanotaenia boesemani TaxID=1250792 RepID=UPI001C0455BC|nr:caspase a-like isoform X1 [Melanotaenia boesemani]